LAVCLAGLAAAQQNDKKDTQKVSSGEAELGKKIQDAKLPLEKKFELAKKLLEKYPKSALRPQFAEFLLNEIAGLADGEQRISQIENYLGMFTEANEQDLALPYLVDAYITAKRYDDAFGLAPRAIEKDPDNAITLTQLAISGGDLANAGKKDYLEQSKQYVAKAIALIEADKKPAKTDPAYWTEFKKSWLPSLYNAQGIILRADGKREEARASLQKAASLNPVNPFNYYMLGVIADDEYNALAREYQITDRGPAKDALLTKAQAKLDQVIDLYAQAMGKASLNAAYQGLQNALRPNLETYYKARKGSLNGLQELIDKYKK
jgi:tetratricopeptide (TPR) repeat protein